MNEESRMDGTDDRDLAALLAAAGPLARPSPEAMAEARAAVEAEWRAAVATRRNRQRTMTWAAAAGIAVAAVAVWIARPWVQPAHELVGAVERIVGEVEQDSGRGRWTPLAATDALDAGTRLRTGSDGRAALQLGSGIELRLDSRTVIAIAEPGRAVLAEGAVYVDAGAEPGAATQDFLLETPAGTVRHLGTQYEARIVDGALRVGIREGRVEIGSRGGKLLGEAGEQLVLQDGRLTRSQLAATADDWDWVAMVTPPFSIEGRSVDAFLGWAGRETGRAVVYATPEAERRAREVALRGTVEGLTPDEAVVAVLSTTSLQPSLESERIYIEAATP
jgi:ferric-dicitrate binding protein FerR (iron transport regulator)